MYVYVYLNLHDQGVAGLLVAPSTPGLRKLGWGRETRLAVELLWKTLEDWMEEATQSAASSKDDGDVADGFLSMSECCTCLHTGVQLQLSLRVSKGTVR